jgi:hypothetical protein
MIEESIHLTIGSGSWRPKNMWIRWIRIRIRNLLDCLFAFHLTLGNSVELVAHPVSLLSVSVVLKSLGTNRELTALDNIICSITINSSTCSSSSRDGSCSSSSCQAGSAMQLLLQAWVIPKNDLQGLAGSFSWISDHL